MIKSFFRYLITMVLRWEAKLILYRYQPKIVAVTGSVGKTSAKDAIALALQTATTVRSSPKSYNSEIGVPLTILGVANAWHHPLGWLKNILHGFCLIIFRMPYPEWLVLEIGADRVGDIKSLGRWLRPDIAVLTSLPIIPVHVEFFPSPEALFAEKGALLKAVKPTGTIVINDDDERVRELVEKLIADKKFGQRKIVRFGWSDSADIKIGDDHLSIKGLTGKIDYAGHTLPLRLTHLYGRQQLYAVLAGLAVGISANYSILPITQALETYQPPPGRGRLIEGIKNTFILDDSYNASPEAMMAALETLKNFPTTTRRIAVLGDMLELGTYTVDAHREIGKAVALICNQLITVGVRAKFIADGAMNPPTGGGFEKKKTQHFDDAREAGQALQPLLLPGDVVLVKGSQGGRLERVVEEIMAHPEDKAKLLARQEPEWLKR